MTSFTPTTSDETFTGTDGVADTVDYSGSLAADGGINVAYTAGSAEVTGGSGTDELTSIENIIATAFNDTVIVDNSAITGSYMVQLGAGSDIFSINQSSGTWNVDGGSGVDQFTGTLKDVSTGYNLLFTAGAASSVGDISFTGIETLQLVLSSSNDFATLKNGTNDFIDAAGGSDTINVTTIHGPHNLFHGGTMPVSGTSANSVDSDSDTFNLDLSKNGQMQATIAYDASAEAFTIFATNGSNKLTADEFEVVTLKLSGPVTVSGGAPSDGRALHVIGDGGNTLVYDANAGQDINFDMSGGVTHASNIGQYDNFSGAEIHLNGGSGTITLGDGVDTIHAENSNSSTFSTGGGNDLVYGGDGNDSLFGGADHDVLFGGAGNDTFSGGTGDDELNGGLGSDTYLFAAGDGQDYITETTDAGTVNKIVLAAGIATSDVTLAHDDNSNLVINIGSAGDRITVGGYYGDGGKIQEIDFADGTVWTQATFAAVPFNSSTEDSDFINGGTGNDTIHALGGNDIVVGHEGDDQLYGEAGDDFLEGNSGDDHLYGGDGNDALFGDIGFGIFFAGNDYLDGGDGADHMQGGLGNDTYVVDNIGDVAYEGAPQIIDGVNEGDDGIDTVLSSAPSYYVGPYIEILTLTGTGNISGGATGNGSVTINGNSGNNVLHGNAGIDTLIGGAGNDVYTVFNAQTVVTENVNEGTDKVLSTVSCALSANVENLFLNGTADLTATGNALSNVMVGNTGNNLIDGGAGNDRMFGGAGNDTYVVDNDGDRVSEQLVAGHDDGGVDTVMSSVTYHIYSFVENLTLTGTGNINATGNDLANTLTGNAGNNGLNGNTGADTMLGGQGSDTYYVDNSGDTVIENLNEGTSDKVISSVSYALTDNVENLTLITSANLSATGNALDNIIVGNAGNNLIDGGAGIDRLYGGLGSDTFVFGPNSGADIIKDFSASQDDHIDISAYTHGVITTLLVHQSGGNTIIDLGFGNTINVVSTSQADVLSHIVW